MSVIKPLAGIVLILLVSGLIALAGSQGSVSSNGLPLFALCAAIGFALHWLVFVPSFLVQSEHYFDLTGALSYLATVGVALGLNSQLSDRALLLGLLVSIWALRLGSFLFLRVRRSGGDRRFDAIKPHFWRFLFSWTLGGAWVFITLAAALAAMTSLSFQPLGLATLVGVLLWLAGFSIEVIADRQKTRFRRDPANRDRFISSGLWSRSRHPNYFGEIVLWLGIALIALPALHGWQLVTLISPLFVILLLTRGSGIPILEEDARQRWGEDPDWQRYVA
ncbi:MAG: DUF1295 domain-containing protein, partial [Pseudohongiellaceae bacterium]